MRTAILRLLVVFAAALPAAGCGTIIGEGAGLVMGGQGSYMTITPMAADKDAKTLGAYTRFELGTITDGIGGKVPPELLPRLQEAFPEGVRRANLPDSDTGKTLIVRGTIIHYESATTMGFMLGPVEEAICRTELVDKETGQVLGVANCVGRTKARSATGVKEKADGLAKAFVKWIESGFPENRKTKTK